MRNLLVLSLSAAVFSGCLTTQENPNYEQSTAYKADVDRAHQYANVDTVAPSMATYQTAPSAPAPNSAPSQPVHHYGYETAATVTASSPSHMMQTPAMAEAPTDSYYGGQEVSGTPGFMAMQGQSESVAFGATTGAAPASDYSATAPLGAAGTPIAYDYARNMVSVDALTTGSQFPETVARQPFEGAGAGRVYTVKQGDTVYSLSRRSCVGINVIQSMNGLDSNFAIKIGQSLRLPASMC